MKRKSIAIITSVLWFVGCRSPEQSRKSGGSEPEFPIITVKIEGPSEISVVWEPAQSVPAPDVAFLALLRPDRNHFSLVSAPRTGVLTVVQPQRHAHSQDTLAVLGVGSEVAGHAIPVLAMHDGTWLPLRQRTQFLLQEDTIGVIEEHGYWLVLGTISDLDSRVFHRGDPILLRFDRDRHAGIREGKVEWVRRGADSPYSSDVALEFRAPEGAFDNVSGVVSVTASPGSHDSLSAVPASAVVQLALGPAVFVPLGLGRYDLRWISIGPSVGNKIIVRQGLSKGTSVVVRGLAALAAAARDSLARHVKQP